MSEKTNKEAPRKRRFAPKAPRKTKTEVKKEEADEEADNEAAQANLTRNLLRHSYTDAKPKFERKLAPVEVAFGSASGSAQLRQYGSAAPNGGNIPEPKEELYQDPWDYYSYYPVTLPLRRPYAGNPEFLDKLEFGQDSRTKTYDEKFTNPALDLGITENREPSMIFLQLPPTMPMVKRSASANGKEVADSSIKPPGGAQIKEKICQLDELPAGYMGKMLVYKSGKIKLKLGETLYDVSSGVKCVFSQDVVAVNTAEKHCCLVGEVNKRAIVTPDIDSFINILNLE